MNPIPHDIRMGVLAARPRLPPLGGGALFAAAPAKLNLDLRVGPRRDDGYHPLDSLVSKVTLYDRILLRPRRDGQVRLECTGADCGPPESNLALRAARRLASEAPRRVGGADVVLIKGIPPGKGLGGGSSDAAAVLAALNQLWSLHLPPDRLAELAARLGSDVPLFLGPPAGRMTGRGEHLEPIGIHPFVAVLHLPDATCSTAEVYAAFDRLGERPAGAPRAGRRELVQSPPSAWRAGLRNDLAAAAFAVSAEVRAVHDRLAGAAGLPVCLTGSGSAMFLLCDSAAEAANVLRCLPGAVGGRTMVVSPNPW